VQSQNRPHQAKGVNYELLLEMIDAQPKSLIGHKNRALLSLGYYFLARRSEVAVLKFDYLEFFPDRPLYSMISKSKADQMGNGQLTFGSRHSAGLLKIWLEKNPNLFTTYFPRSAIENVLIATYTIEAHLRL
jgi:integrase/recombinase XerD